MAAAVVSTKVAAASSSSFAAGDLSASFRRMAVARNAPAAAAPARLHVEMSRQCSFTGKKANNGYAVTFSHKRNKKLQQPNLQTKNLFWEKENRWVKVKIATSTLKTIQKVGLDEMAKRHDVDLYALPYTDYSDARRDWLKANQGKPPVKKNKRAMKHSTPKPTTV